jgi:hypothetical protein
MKMWPFSWSLGLGLAWFPLAMKTLGGVWEGAGGCLMILQGDYSLSGTCQLLRTPLPSSSSLVQT